MSRVRAPGGSPKIFSEFFFLWPWLMRSCLVLSETDVSNLAATSEITMHNYTYVEKGRKEGRVKESTKTVGDIWTWSTKTVVDIWTWSTGPLRQLLIFGP